MKLHEFLSLIEDEDARIEIEIDDDKLSKDEYIYSHFWLSDFLVFDDTNKYYRDYTVVKFSFIPEIREDAQIRIQIKP